MNCNAVVVRELCIRGLSCNSVLLYLHIKAFVFVKTSWAQAVCLTKEPSGSINIWNNWIISHTLRHTGVRMSSAGQFLFKCFFFYTYDQTFLTSTSL